MKVVVDSLVEGAERATGVVAVIDVFRAFTSAAVALANGASRIIMVRSVEEALGLRQTGVGQFCIGEVGGRAPDGFDFGNSPFEIASVDCHGKTVIQRTSAGTRALVGIQPRGASLRGFALPADATAFRISPQPWNLLACRIEIARRRLAMA